MISTKRDYSMKGSTKLNSDIIKSLRLNMFLSQNSLANKSLESGCSLSLATIKRAESGKNVSFRTVINYATFFDVEKKVILATNKDRSRPIEYQISRNNIDIP
jgi:hypothetical protein